MTPVSIVFTESGAILPDSSGPLAGGEPGVSTAGYGFRALTGALAIGAVMLASDSVLMLSPWCKSTLAFAVFTALVISRTCPGGGVRWLALPALHLAGMYASLRIDGAAARVFVISWLFLSLELSVRRSRSSVMILMHWAGLAFAGFLLCYGRIDAVWWGLRWLGESGSRGTPLGLWVSAFPVYLMGALAVLPVLVWGRPGLRELARGGSLAAALAAAFVAGREVLAAAAPIGQAAVTGLQVGSLVSVAMIVAGLRFRCPGPRRIAAVSSLLAIAALLPCLLHQRSKPAIHHPRPGAAPGTSVGFYSEGLLDWRLPDSTSLGLANSGMFGILRRDVEECARRVGGRVVASDSISEEFLSGLHILVFINPSRRPAAEEIEALERFVREGNAMLVLGDHTNIGDSRGPLNAVLAFTGIRFNFDSAVPHRHGWQGCLEIRRHPVNSGVDGDVMAQLAVGASLETERPAIPLILARYGFSDAGDHSNRGRGGFMGNIVHERGEPVGDLVLVACEHVGMGRVLVFGDTSPFQNAALFVSRRLVKNSFDWLQGSETGLIRADDVCESTGRSKAVIDFSLKPGVNLELFTERSLGGLANCLIRADMRPVPALETGQWDRDAPFLFLIDPTETIGTRESEWLFDYMASGGHVVLAKGYASPQPADLLLLRLGLEIHPLPLGGGDSTSAFTHKDAWAVSLVNEGSAEILSRAFGYPTVVTSRFGAGAFTLIADGRALLDENLESEWTGDRANIGFIVNLIQGLPMRNLPVQESPIDDFKKRVSYAEARED
jgi:hypothetical protein